MMSALPLGAVASDQWLRRCSLIVSDASGSGLDLSNLRIKFRTEQADLSQGRPGTAVITVYNLAATTLAKVLEFSQVTLQAGYQPPGKFGIIFKGTIKQFERGHESPTDSYLTLFCSDTDAAWFAITNKTLAPGYTAQDELNAHVDAMKPSGASLGYNGLAGGTGGLPQGLRGKLVLGPATGGLDQLGQTNQFTWVVVNGKVQVIPLTSYLPGAAVVLNSQSGLVGWPVNNLQGVEATCLLNPAIRLQGLVQIAEKDVNQIGPAKGSGIPGFPNAVQGFPGSGSQEFVAMIAADGFYRAMVIEHEGDTRGNSWYTYLTLLAADLSAPAGSQVPVIAPVAPGTP